MGGWEAGGERSRQLLSGFPSCQAAGWQWLSLLKFRALLNCNFMWATAPSGFRALVLNLWAQEWSWLPPTVAATSGMLHRALLVSFKHAFGFNSPFIKFPPNAPFE